MKTILIFVLFGIVVVQIMTPTAEERHEESMRIRIDSLQREYDKLQKQNNRISSFLAGKAAHPEYIDSMKKREALDFYQKDDSGERLHMYSALVEAFDSLYFLACDPRSDAIWCAIRHRLSFVSLREADTTNWNLIDSYYVPVLVVSEYEKAGEWSPFFFGKDACGSLSYIWQDEFPKYAIAIEVNTMYPLLLSAMILYHEGYHLTHSKDPGIIDLRERPQKEELSEHERIRNFEQDLFNVLVQNDSTFLHFSEFVY